MPSYFYHLKLELYSAPASTDKPTLKQSDSSNIYLPTAGKDIFSSFPAHRTSCWPSYAFGTRRPDTPNSLSSSSERSKSPQRLPTSEQHSESHGDALLLPEKRADLKDHLPVPAPSLNAPKHTNAAAANDWRYDAVSIESIDMEGAADTSSMQAEDGSVKSAVSGLHTKASYLPSNPRQTDIGYGVVHLYRDTEETEVLGKEHKLSRKSLEAAGSGQDEAPFKPSDCTTLGILAVPSWMMPSDLLGFVGDEAREHVSHFRLIRTGRANKYMVLMKFRSAKKAGEWQKAY
ncbi:hypothetical protein KC334_g21483, partial [Hortaea werneckii]